MLGSMVQLKKFGIKFCSFKGLKATNSVKASISNFSKGAFKEAFVKKPNNIISGFNKSGLCPQDKERESAKI